MKRLYRSRENRLIAGVCGGIGTYLNVDPVMIRVIAIFLLFLGGGGIIAYIIAILIIPLEPDPETARNKSENGIQKTVAKEKLSPASSTAAETAIQKHVSLLGWIYIVLNALTLCIAITVFAIVAGGGMLSGDETAIMITMIVASAVAGLLLLLSVPGIICGAGLIKFRPWARTLALVLGIINLINIPFGTILGVYTLWVMMQPASESLFKHQS